MTDKIMKTIECVSVAAALLWGYNVFHPSQHIGRGYDFKGTIANEEIYFNHRSFKGDTILEVKRADGTLVKYHDKRADLEVDALHITEEGKSSKYTQNEILEVASTQFAGYFEKIKASKEASREAEKSRGLSCLLKQ